MRPIIAVEFSAKGENIEIKEESVSLRDVGELFAFVSPGGGCESIPTEVDEIKVVFLKPAHGNTGNPIADLPVTLQLGMILFSGPLAEISQVAEQLIDKAGRGELSRAFLAVIGGLPADRAEPAPNT